MFYQDFYGLIALINYHYFILNNMKKTIMLIRSFNTTLILIASFNHQVRSLRHSIYLKDKVTETERDERREFFHSLIYSLNSHSGLDCLGWSQEPRVPFWSSLRVVGGQTPASNFLPFQTHSHAAGWKANQSGLEAASHCGISSILSRHVSTALQRPPSQPFDRKLALIVYFWSTFE